MILPTDKCPEGWLTWDNSCYRLETSSAMIGVTQDQGRSHCMNAYNGLLAIPNSKDEAAFLGAYLNGITVSNNSEHFPMQAS